MSPRTLDLAGIVADADTATEVEVYIGTPEWYALMEWLEFHGIDPRMVPAGSRISRDACGRCIRYVGFVPDAEGHRQLDPDTLDTGDRGDIACLKAPMVEQGEAPPLPYPDVIARQLR